jgi:hypothetical protein
VKENCAGGANCYLVPAPGDRNRAAMVYGINAETSIASRQARQIFHSVKLLP